MVPFEGRYGEEREQGRCGAEGEHRRFAAVRGADGSFGGEDGGYGGGTRDGGDGGSDGGGGTPTERQSGDRRSIDRTFQGSISQGRSGQIGGNEGDGSSSGGGGAAGG